MATVLAISSKVARGSVGLNAIVPALQAFGHHVIELPTVWLSNHPGHGRVAGRRIDAALLADMLDAIDGHGWLAGVDAVLSGYLPSTEHVAFVEKAVARVREAALAAGRGHVAYWCDPVIGDDPKGVYIEAAAAEAIRDRLVPLADVVTPNRFELEYLASAKGHVGISRFQDLWACRLGRARIVAKSLPADDPGQLVTATVHERECLVVRVGKRPRVPHGTGDLFAAACLGSDLADPGRFDIALGLATRVVERVIEKSIGRTDLDVTEMDVSGPPVAVETYWLTQIFGRDTVVRSGANDDGRGE